ncbi:MAG: hypothetical protein GJ680_02115 [Alteromonadaceae bacterium]|nr:hypothetical protein [Alteromonadaceae bacterium]
MNLQNLTEPKNLKVIAALVLVALILFIPKPQRIKYEYANMVSESTYWDGLGGSGVLFDAKASFVRLDKDTNHLHVCHSVTDTSNCLKYRVIENKGFTGYLLSFFE